MNGPEKFAAALLFAAALTGCAPSAGRSTSAVPAPAPQSSPSSPATVAHVIDGDTIIVSTRARARARSRRVRVRLLGIDAPEDTRLRECFGAQATAALRRLLPTGAAILLALDRRRTDPYGRTLGYVWRPDGVFVNRALVRRGYAATLFLPPDGPYRAELAAAEALARATGAGLWRACRRRP
jgi:micrococcal nuclease